MMKSKLLFNFIVIILLFVIGFIFLFDRYQYYDYEILECRSSIAIAKSILSDAYPDSLPDKNGGTYFLRIEVNHTGDIGLLNNLVFTSQLTQKSINLDVVVESAPAKHDHKSTAFITDSILLPYDDYLLTGFFLLNNSTREKFECIIQRQYSEEFRLTFVH